MVENASGQQASPLVTVVTPLYNKEPYIRRCLESILAQTLQDFEIIVVDDGSRDGGPEIVASILRDGDQLIQQANAGPGPARNTAVAAGRGQFIAFLDADDTWMPEFLATIMDLFDRYPAAGLACCRPYPERMRVFPPGQTDGLLEDYFAAAMRVGGYICSTSATMVRRQAFECVGGFVYRNMGEDVDLWCRIALEFPVAYSEQMAAHYHFGVPGSDTSTLAPVYPRFVETVKRLGTGGIPPHLESSIRVYCGTLLDGHALSLVRAGKRAEARAILEEARQFAPLNPIFGSLRWRVLLPSWMHKGLTAWRSRGVSSGHDACGP